MLLAARLRPEMRVLVRRRSAAVDPLPITTQGQLRSGRPSATSCDRGSGEQVEVSEQSHDESRRVAADVDRVGAGAHSAVESDPDHLAVDV